MWLLALFAAGAAVALIAWLRQPVPVQGQYIQATDSYLPPFEAAGVGVISIAIDPRARRFVENELVRDPSLREATQLLRRVRDVWLAGSVQPQPGRRASYDAAVAAATPPGDALLVTIVIATQHELALAASSDPEEVRKTLETALYRDDIVHHHIAWVPLAASATADDKSFCRECNAPNVAEWLRCPYCGISDINAA